MGMQRVLEAPAAPIVVVALTLIHAIVQCAQTGRTVGFVLTPVYVVDGGHACRHHSPVCVWTGTIVFRLHKLSQEQPCRYGLHKATSVETVWRCRRAILKVKGISRCGLFSACSLRRRSHPPRDRASWCHEGHLSIWEYS